MSGYGTGPGGYGNDPTYPYGYYPPQDARRPVPADVLDDNWGHGGPHSRDLTRTAEARVEPAPHGTWPGEPKLISPVPMRFDTRNRVVQANAADSCTIPMIRTVSNVRGITIRDVVMPVIGNELYAMLDVRVDGANIPHEGMSSSKPFRIVLPLTRTNTINNVVFAHVKGPVMMSVPGAYINETGKQVTVNLFTQGGAQYGYTLGSTAINQNFSFTLEFEVVSSASPM